jgi:ribokinase
VVDVGDDAETANPVEGRHNFSILADRRAVPGTVLPVTRVVVVGSANVDLVWHGPRLPAPGETTTDGRFATVLGGKGANQAAAARALGAEVRFVGCVGDDAHGATILADLAAREIDCAFVARSPAPTGTAFVLVDAAGENMVAVAPGANRSLDAGAVAEAIAADDVVLCSCEIPLDVVQAAVTTALARGARVIVNPAPARQVFAGAILTPNEHECRALGGIDALLAVAPAVVVTRGRDGADVHLPGTLPSHEPGFAVGVTDTTGAGDAFNGALAWSLSEGRELRDAVRLACAAGALATRGLGARASLPSADEVYALATS